MDAKTEGFGRRRMLPEFCGAKPDMEQCSQCGRFIVRFGGNAERICFRQMPLRLLYHSRMKNSKGSGFFAVGRKMPEISIKIQQIHKKFKNFGFSVAFLQEMVYIYFKRFSALITKRKKDLMDMVNVGWLSVLPPLIAIVLALLTKEVIPSLMVGILSGTLIYSCFTASGAGIAVKTVEEFMQKESSVRKVIFNVFKDRDEEIYRKLLGAYSAS